MRITEANPITHEEVKLLVDIHPCRIAFTLQDVSLTRSGLVGHLYITDMSAQDFDFIFPSHKRFDLQIENHDYPEDEEFAIYSAQLAEKEITNKGWLLRFVF